MFQLSESCTDCAIPLDSSAIRSCSFGNLLEIVEQNWKILTLGEIIFEFQNSSGKNIDCFTSFERRLIQLKLF